MKTWQPRPVSKDPDDLEERWIAYASELLQRQALTRSEIEATRIGMRTYSEAKPGKARHLMGQLNKRLA